MATKKTVKKVVKKTAKKVESKQSHEKKIQRNLILAREIMEHHTDGFIIIAKIERQTKGFSMEGACVTQGVTEEQIARVVMENMEMDPTPFILAHLKEKGLKI